jgi:hypothetical protein
VRDLLRELVHVLALVAVLGRLLPARAGVDRLAEPGDLAAGVVEVVLGLDLVAQEGEQAPQGVAVRGVAPGRPGERAGRVGGDELDLDLLGRIGLPAAVGVARGQDVRGGSAVPGVGEEQVQEARARDLDPLQALAEPFRERRAEALGDLARRAFRDGASSIAALVEKSPKPAFFGRSSVGCTPWRARRCAGPPPRRPRPP